MGFGGKGGEGSEDCHIAIQTDVPSLNVDACLTPMRGRGMEANEGKGNLMEGEGEGEVERGEGKGNGNGSQGKGKGES